MTWIFFRFPIIGLLKQQCFNSTYFFTGIKGRQNFGIVIDTSENMGRENFKQSIVFIERLVQHISVSLGTTRISVSTVGNSFIKHLGVTESINREHLLDNLKKIR